LSEWLAVIVAIPAWTWPKGEVEAGAFDYGTDSFEEEACLLIGPIEADYLYRELSALRRRIPFVDLTRLQEAKVSIQLLLQQCEMISVPRQMIGNRETNVSRLLIEAHDIDDALFLDSHAGMTANEPS
jgi:hypothetical protein